MVNDNLEADRAAYDEIRIVQAQSEEQVAKARLLFREYEAWLGLDLCFQGFEEELAGLPGKYAEPDGRLLLAYSDGSLAGCVALRKLDDRTGEMKRLYVRGEFRGKKVGAVLMERIIADASHIGYRAIRLDTFPPKMEAAVRMYHKFGFGEIPPYYDNPHDETLYMELKL